MVSSILSLIYQLIIGPLVLLFEFVFSVSYSHIDNPGICIIILSIVMNLMALPLYRRADAIQKKERDVETALKPGIDHIKKTFKGDERFFIMQTLYRQNSYSPVHVLKGSLSLFLQIPFFMAAYKMLSGLYILSGESFGPISDLGMPDGLIVLGPVTINLLPLLMTAINMVSSVIYLRGRDIKQKIQMFAVAAVFLVLLYRSPAGLVFYWTCNNVFSLLKNIIKRRKEPEEKRSFHGTYTGSFVLSCVYIALFIGIYIPSNAMKSSPLDFTDVFHYCDPSKYLIYPLVTSLGVFVVWGSVLYFMSSDKVRKILCLITISLSVIFTCDYTLFKVYYGDIKARLIYTMADMSRTSYLFETCVLIVVVACILYLVYRHLMKYMNYFLVASIIIVAAFGGYNILQIHKTIEGHSYAPEHLETASIKLNRNGKNVVVIMLDRALGTVVPYVFNELPYLSEQFDGFTYYPNTVSLGAHTNTGAPGVFGGYDYAPENMDMRDDMLLKDKHNEALLMLPLMFLEEGADVTLCDPPYADYQVMTDLSIFDEYEGIDSYITTGAFNEYSDDQYEEIVRLYRRNLFCFSLFRAMPPCLHSLFYDGGNYNDPDYLYDYRYMCHYTYDGSRSIGYDHDFLNSISVLDSLPMITDVGTGDNMTYTVLVNYTTHSEMILKEPEYSPEYRTNNTQYDEANSSRFTLGDESLNVENYRGLSHYQVNAAAYIRLGLWFDYLREQGVYDNTRIIIVSDHGYDLGLKPDWSNDSVSAEVYNPVLMVKDFDAEGFTVSNEFMTNADTPFLAVTGLIEDPVNPFTGNPVDTSYKDDGEVTVFASHDFFIGDNNGTAFIPGPWYYVSDDMRGIDNWEYAGEW